MRDHYDFSDAVKNPFAGKLNKEGYTVIVHYGPQDIAEMDGSARYEPTPDEAAAFEEYRANKKAQ